MCFEEALKVLDDLVYAKRGKHLSEAEKILVEGAWHDKGYGEIANNSTYSINYLQRDVAPQLWDLLSDLIGSGKKVGKKKLRYIIEQSLTKPNSYYLPDVEQPKAFNTLLNVYGGHLPKISSFYGRVEELDILKQWITQQRGVVLVGAAGIGKSALVAKLIEEIRTKPQYGFECFIWKSVSYAPLLPDLVTDLLKLLANPLETELKFSESTQANVAMLIERLRSRRSLVVLDAAEALLQGNRNNRFNPYGEQHSEYGLFFRRLVESQHQSCLILNSQSPFSDLASLNAQGRPVSTLKLEGLDANAAMQLLNAKGLTQPEECSELIQKYRGNPLELVTVANKIQRFFGGTEEFFKNHKTTFMSPHSQAMLNQLFGQAGLLSELQRQIMIYLAEEISKSIAPVGFTKLVSDLSNNDHKGSLSTSELIEALEELEERSLIERGENSVNKEASFTLRPVVKKYIMTDPLGLVRKSANTIKSA